MKQYPHKRIRISEHDWDIYVVPKKHPKLLKACGTTHFKEKEIYVANHLSKKNFRWTLTHELLHAHFDELGFHDIMLEKLHLKKNEQMVDALAELLYPLMRSSVFKIAQYQEKERTRE